RVSGNGTPVIGLVISSILVTLLVAANYTRSLVQLFTFSILLATLSCLVPYLFSALAEWTILRQESRGRLGPVVVALLAFLYSFWGIAGSGQEAVYWGFLLLMAGVPVYVWVRRHRPAAV